MRARRKRSCVGNEFWLPSPYCCKDMQLIRKHMSRGVVGRKRQNLCERTRYGRRVERKPRGNDGHGGSFRVRRRTTVVGRLRRMGWKDDAGRASKRARSNGRIEAGRAKEATALQIDGSTRASVCRKVRKRRRSEQCWEKTEDDEGCSKCLSLS